MIYFFFIFCIALPQMFLDKSAVRGTKGDDKSLQSCDIVEMYTALQGRRR